MLHPELDPTRLSSEFVRTGRLQVRQVLQERAAQLLFECLSTSVPLSLAYRDGERSRMVPRDAYAALDDEGRRQLVLGAQRAAVGRYGFAYESYMMVKAYLDKLDPELILHPVLEYLNSEEFLWFARTLTGLPQIRRVNAQATRYRAGHFLRRHDDFDAAEGRLFAYVFNLTPRWNTDWGGLMHFVGRDGDVMDTYFPHWNSLSVFKVPHEHMVSAVAPFAEGDRLSITGWFQS